MRKGVYTRYMTDRMRKDGAGWRKKDKLNRAFEVIWSSE